MAQGDRDEAEEKRLDGGVEEELQGRVRGFMMVSVTRDASGVRRGWSPGIP